MADESEVAVKVAAKTEGLTDGLAKATGTIKETVAKIEGHLSGLTRTVENLKSPFIALSGILAGGAMFKAAMQATTGWTGEVVRLSRSLGITTQAASGFAVACRIAGIETDSVTGLSQKLVMSMASGGKALEKNGIHIKDQNGQLKSTGIIIQEVAAKYATFGTQQDKNAFLAQLFGRRMMEAQGVIRALSEHLKEGQEKAKALGLEIGPEGAANAKHYKEAMNELDLITLSFKNSVGKELMPALTSLSQYLSSTGPSSASGFAYVIKGVIQACYTLKAVIENLASVVMATVMTMVDGWKMVGTVMYNVATGNLKGAVQAAKDGARDIKNEWLAAADSISQSWANHNKASSELWKPTPTKAAKPEAGGAHFGEGDEKKPKSKMQDFELELKKEEDANAAKLEAEGKYHERSLADELAFWQKKLEEIGKKAPEAKEIEGKILDLQRNQRKQVFQEHLAELQAEEDAAKNNLQLKHSLVMQEVALYADGTKEQIAAKKKLAAVEREIEEQILRINADMRETKKAMRLAEIEEQTAVLEHRVAMEEISAEESIQIEHGLIQQKFAEERALLEWRAENEAKTPEEEAKIANQIVALDRQKTFALAANARKLAEVQKQTANSFLSPFKDAFQSTLEQLLNRTKTWSQAISNLWKSLGRVFTQMAAKMATEWAASEAKKLMATIAVKTKELLFHKTVETEKAVATVQSSGTSAMAAGVEAGAKGAASAASIPYVGWILAIGAGLAIIAGVKSMMGGMPSAEGGWGQIPGDTLAQVHKDEMILPAHYAAGLRGMLEGGQDQQGGETHVHFHTNAIDTKGVQGFFSEHGTAIADTVASQARRGRLGVRNMGGFRS